MRGAAPTPGDGIAMLYHADGEGPIRMITDANVTVFNRYGYDSFGRRPAVVGKPSLAAPSLEGAGNGSPARTSIP